MRINCVKQVSNLIGLPYFLDALSSLDPMPSLTHSHHRFRLIFFCNEFIGHFIRTISVKFYIIKFELLTVLTCGVSDTAKCYLYNIFMLILGFGLKRKGKG